jgi:Flp pilus assembly protein TadB
VIAFFAFSYLNKEMMKPMMTTRTGQYILLYAAVSIMAGYGVMMKIADIEL